MNVIGLVGCGKAKRSSPAPARSLYTGPLTKLAIRWMERNCQTWFILSAKCGLLEPSRVIAPYNVQMSDLTRQERKAWGQRVRAVLPTGKPILVIAGKAYIDALGIEVVDLCSGLNMFERMAWLKQHPVLTGEMLLSLRS